MSFETEFSQLVAAIRALSNEYDTFLFGSHGKLPVESRRRVDDLIRHLANSKIEAPADRFRLNTLLGQYNARCERWERQLRDREEGKGPQFRRQTGTIHLNAGEPGSVKASEELQPDRVTYDQYCTARKSVGDAGDLDFDNFRQTLAREREKLVAKTGMADWSFEVVTEDGRVKLKARPK
jgi:hypothetical protein